MINVFLVCSTKDPAGINVYNHLSPKFIDKKVVWDSHPVLFTQMKHCAVFLCKTDKELVYYENMDLALEKSVGVKPYVVVFCTKHASKSGIPTLSVHTQGNWDSADLGGNPREIAMCPVVLKNALYRELVVKNTLGFDVVNEATHHGPSMVTAAMFIEIGSVMEQWIDKSAGKIICESLLSVLDAYVGEVSSGVPVLVGIGGNHTCANFNRISADGSILLSHVCPNYHIDHVTGEMFTQAIAKSTLPSVIAIDWKSITAQQRERIVGLLDAAGLSYKKLKDFKE